MNYTSTTHNDYGMCLFKAARPSTGEDWSEKIAAELCELLRLPHAEYELARYKGLPGTISKNLGHITTGDEVLQEVISDYPRDRSISSFTNFRSQKVVNLLILG